MVEYCTALADSCENNYQSWVTKTEGETGQKKGDGQFLVLNVPSESNKHFEAGSAEVSHVETAGYSI